MLYKRFSLSRVSDYEEELTAFGLLGDSIIPDPEKPLVAAFDKVSYTVFGKYCPISLLA